MIASPPTYVSGMRGLMGAGSHWYLDSRAPNFNGCRVAWVLGFIGIEHLGRRVSWVPRLMGVGFHGGRVAWRLGFSLPGGKGEPPFRAHGSDRRRSFTASFLLSNNKIDRDDYEKPGGGPKMFASRLARLSHS